MIGVKPAIKVTNLRYSYPDKTLGLNGITFEITEKELVCFIGTNGSGKTTLLLNLMGILVGEGEIEILGSRLQKKNSHLKVKSYQNARQSFHQGKQFKLKEGIHACDEFGQEIVLLLFGVKSNEKILN